jgi:trk system potassium uptake protein TrkA
VGSSLALSLTETGHTVAVVDRRQEAFARLGNAFTGTTVTGIGFDQGKLKEAGIERASAVAAVTSGDNSNILVARVARETFGVERVVARIYDPRRAMIYQRLGIPTVATVAWTTERVLRRILPDEPAVEWVDPSAKVTLVERVVPATWGGRQLEEFELPGVMRIMALGRYGTATVPKPGVVLQEGDVLHLSAAGDAIAQVDAHLAGPSKGGH